MSTSSKELKRMARANLTGRYQIPMFAFILATLITTATDMILTSVIPAYPSTFFTVVIYVFQFAILLLGIFFTFGQILIHLCMIRNFPFSVNQLFFGFQRRPERVFVVGLVLAIVQCLASAPLFYGQTLAANKLVGTGLLSLTSMDILELSKIYCFYGLLTWVLQLIVQLIFQFPLYLLLDYPDENPMKCLSRGIALMNGHRLRLLYLILSFIGLDILEVLSFGIGALWIEPYKMQTYALFYSDVVYNRSVG